MRRPGIEPGLPPWHSGVPPLNYRRLVGMWIPGIEPGQEALQASALPSELNPRNAANGSRTHDLPVDNRTLVPLSYGDEIGHEVFKEPVNPTGK